MGKIDSHSKIAVVSRFVVTYAALSITLIALFVVAEFSLLRQHEFDRLRHVSQSVAEGVASEIDVSAHEKLIFSEQEGSTEYVELRDVLQRATLYNSDVAGVYTMRKTDDPNIVTFVVDSYVTEDTDGDGIIDSDEEAAHLGEEYDASDLPELRMGFVESSADREIARDQWGTWISGYAPLYDAQGNSVGLVGVDISAAVYEESLTQFRQDLLLMVAIGLLLSIAFGFWGRAIFQKENRIIHEALTIRASDLEREVKARTRALEDFVAMLVHEFRAPLTNIRVGLEYILEEPKMSSKERRSLLETIHETTSRVASLINDLLDAAKLEGGKFTLQKSSTDLVEVARSILDENEAIAKEKGLGISIDTEGRPTKFRFDAKRISQCIRNLLSNAIKYTDRGSVAVRVIFAKPGVVRVEVQDTGSGIPKEELKLLFQPFIRLRQTGEQLGTGLGLSVVRGIVEAHDGTFGVDSEVKKGSTFWFELPRKEKS